ncbi:MAG: hypothetical protein WC365_07385 [Candidatus Babeliales bacterium]|jgi:hypothetical protein
MSYWTIPNKPIEAGDQVFVRDGNKTFTGVVKNVRPSSWSDTTEFDIDINGITYGYRNSFDYKSVSLCPVLVKEAL